MSVPVGTDEPSPPTPEVVDPPERPGVHPTPSARDAVAGICPYLASAGGSWRAAVPSRDHRCTAVQPAAPQTTEKQRRHCLGAGHVDCPMFRAARAARTTGLASGIDPALIELADRRRRVIARTAPIVLEPPRLVDQAMRLQFDRAPGQIALVGLMLVAFAVVAIARFSGGAAAGPTSPQASTVAVVRPSPRATPRATASSSVEASPSASAAPAFRTTYTVKKGDTLVGIANRFKTTAAKIRTVNGMKSNSLKIGQVLKIP